VPEASISYNEHDQQIWEEELNEFIPDHVFDAHIHLFHPQHLSTNHSSQWIHTDLQTLNRWSDRLYPERQTHFLVLGTPTHGLDIDAHNQWALGQVQTDPQSRFHRLVTPQCTPDDIRKDVQHVAA